MKAWFLPVVLVLAAAMPALAGDDPVAVKGRELLEANKDAMVLVKAVVEISGGGQLGMMLSRSSGRERSASGVIVDESGLVILPYNLLDISSLYRGLAARLGGEGGDAELKTDIKDIRIRLANGSQIPARLVFKDEDLGICFVAPQEKLKESDQKTIKALAMDKVEPDLKVMDQVIMVGRLSEALDFEPCLDLERIQAVVKKPRKQYVANVTPGMPVFSVEGKLAGFSILIPTAGEGQGASPVILPVGEITDLTKQAKAALKKSEE